MLCSALCPASEEIMLKIIMLQSATKRYGPAPVKSKRVCIANRMMPTDTASVVPTATAMSCESTVPPRPPSMSDSATVKTASMM